MKQSPDTIIGRMLNFAVVGVLVLMPLHAFLTVWVASVAGNYTAVRLWKEVVLVLLAVGAIYVAVRSKGLIKQIFSDKYLKILILLILGYIGLHLVWGIYGLLGGSLADKALGYSLISNLRFMVFFVICMVFAAVYQKFWQTNWRKVLLYPAAIVVVFGLLQFLVLPIDFLKHFGYGADTISPYIAVDQKDDYARVQSSMRGPNPLGAYVLVVLTALVTMLLARRSFRVLIVALASLIVLFATYSRSAWLGFVSASAFVAASHVPRRFYKVFAFVSVGVIVFMALAIFILRDNDFVQNVVFHTDENSLSQTSSNEDRLGAITSGVSDIASHPLGQGPGSAGPASVYNDAPARISENYFIQIGQEVGIAGLVLFIGICVIICVKLWQIRSDGLLPIIMLASFVGITVVNIMSHAWADDTLAYVWWGFSGIAIGLCLNARSSKTRKL